MGWKPPGILHVLKLHGGVILQQYIQLHGGVILQQYIQEPESIVSP